jgi:hypothetical protein
VWNCVPVTLLLVRILRWLLDFLKFVELYGRYQMAGIEAVFGFSRQILE